MIRSFACSVGLAFIATNAWSAPAQLLNKTIVSSYTATVPAVEDDGRQVVATRTTLRRIYVSSAGRIFEKRSQIGRKNRRDAELEPGSTKLKFVGSKLTAYLPTAEGVILLEYAFDASFRNCNVLVVSGRTEGRARRWRALNGKMRTATGPTAISAVSCSVLDGNAL
jgi:hypothetical protein